MSNILSGSLASLASTPENPQWDEEPVPLTQFVQDKGYLGQPALSEIQYDAVRHAERIFYEPTYALLSASSDKQIRLYWSEPVRMVNFLELEWGKGGGKDHVCRVSSLRIAYLLLCLPSPQAYYAMPEQDTIHMLNVASNSKQASKAFFKPMREMVRRQGGWFARQGGIEAIEATGRRGVGQSEVLQDTIRFPKKVEAVSGHSDADAQEGLNLILGLADEIDAFPRAEELARYHQATARGESSRSAEAIVNMLGSSARTRFPLIFKNIHISWPRYLGSMIQTLVASAEEDIQEKGERSRYYISGPHPSWRVNPRIQVPCGEKHQSYADDCELCYAACKELFEDDYKKDPPKAAAMYEARPSRAINPYFANELVVKAAFPQVPQAPVVAGYERDGRSYRPVYTFSSAFRPLVGAQYAMHFDLATSGDRAGACIAHVAQWQTHEVLGYDEEQGEVRLFEERPVVRVDALFAYESDKRLQPPREIQIRWARLLVMELIRQGWAIRLVTFDGFESADTRQILTLQHGVETAVVSTDRSTSLKSGEKPSGVQGEALWKSLGDLFAEDRITVPGFGDQHELAQHELLALSRMPNGKVDHPPGGSKDLADALAGAAAGALFLGGQEESQQSYPGQGIEIWNTTADPDALPVGFIAPDAGQYSSPLEAIPVLLDGMGRPQLGDPFPEAAEEPAHWG